MLEGLAQQDSPIISLGCDLGQHFEKERPLKRRRVAGGYVQIASARLGQPGAPELLAVARGMERSLRADVGDDFWDVNFELGLVHFKFGELIEGIAYDSARIIPAPRTEKSRDADGR